MIKLFTLSIIGLLIASCGLTYKVLLGVDVSPEWNTEKQIEKQAKRYSIPTEYNLLLDTASYRKELKYIYAEAYKALEINQGDSSHLANLRKARNDDLQPAQFRLFDQKGVEVFKLVNCYIDPPIPLDWNVDGCFDAFPPNISYEALNIHMFSLEFLLSHVTRIQQQKFAYTDLPEADFYGVIFWNDYFKRPSRRLIKTVREFIDKTGNSISLIYINNHNQFLWSAMDSYSKEQVKKELLE